MDDLISRQTAIDALGERPMVWTSDDDYALGERNQYDLDRLAVETVPSAERHGKWIPCKERLPDDGVNVLVQFIDGYTEICRLLGGCWEVLYGEYTGVHTAVAWMPLPEPYKGDD